MRGFHALAVALAERPRRVHRRRRALLATGAAVAAGGILPPAPADAAPVLVYDRGEVRRAELRAVPYATLPPPRPERSRPPRLEASAAAARSDPVRRAVLRAERQELISAAESLRYRSLYNSARGLYRRLGGLRRRELGDVIAVLQGEAARGRLTSSRMPALFLTLRRNREWFARRGPPRAGAPPGGVRRKRCKLIRSPLRASAQRGGRGRASAQRGGRGRPVARAARVRFAGSRVIFQYYPGHGLQIQPLANFGAANNYWSQRTPEGNEALEGLLDELVALAAVRDGFTTWEYHFPFGGGRPPWTSGISQGTAIQALSRAAVRLGRSDYFEVARAALGAFERATPAGVRVRLARDGNWYALYSFSPGLRVLNAHLQAVNGLHDFGALANDERGRGLYREGLRAARRRIGAYDTGAWSKYASPGVEADLNYHVLNRSLARKLCERSSEAAICGAAERFSRYLTEPPRIGVLHTGRPALNRPTSVSFFLSKIATVSVFVKRRGETVRDAYGLRGRGRRRVAFRAPSRPGTYRIDLLACDLAGNAEDRQGTLRVR